MDERLRFVRNALRDRFTMRELCARYGVSRRIGYKWLARYDAEGRTGLADRSHVPPHCPHRVPPAMEALLITERLAHPYWAGRKLLAVLTRRHSRM
jgi:transposase-like protein